MPKKKKKSSNPRSLQLTADMVDEMARIVRGGNFRYVAAQRLGVPTRTLQSWLLRGRKEIRRFEEGRVDESDLTLKAALVWALDEAEALAHQDILADVVHSESVQAKMWFLERRYNKLYSRNPNAVVDDEHQDTYKVDAVQLLAERLKELAEDK